MRNRKHFLLAIAMLGALLSPTVSLAGGFTSQFSDSLDGSFDISRWLSSRYGFMPLASLITEPAVGYGVAGGLVFLHQSYADAVESGTPPSTSAAFGLITENETWGAGVAHSGFYRDDTIRYSGALGYVSPNLAVYRDLPQPIGTVKFGFNMKGWFTSHDMAFRIKQTGLFVGAQYMFFANRVKFDIPGKLPFDPRERMLDIGGAGPVLVFDNRDNVFSPNSGVRSRIAYRYHDEFLGSDRNFNRLDLIGLGYSDRVDNLVIGLRLDTRFAWGNTPFYSLPYVDLRGIPAMRYQGDQVYVAESEVRWGFHRRWAVVGFGGLGYSVLPSEEFGDGENVWNAGAGGRYFISRLFGIYSGIDVARGPEDWAFYIQFGSAWASY